MFPISAERQVHNAPVAGAKSLSGEKKIPRKLQEKSKSRHDVVSNCTQGSSINSVVSFWSPWSTSCFALANPSL
jgi:hypothetical protein